MAKNPKLSGAETFEVHFSNRFGTRWPQLKTALQSEGLYSSPTELLQDYFLNPASLCAAQALLVAPGHHVLDLCAAPGGKCLELARSLQGQGSLVANEMSDNRRARLFRVLQEHLPPHLHQTCKIIGRDGSKIGQSHPQCFDRILCDVPCSSEEHVLSSPKHLAEWTPARTKNLSLRQFSLLCSGFDSLRPGGILVYSTCSISAEENDQICERLSKKRTGFCWDRLSHLPGESSEFGQWILPDHCPGQGPIFIARLRKDLNSSPLSIS